MNLKSYVLILLMVLLVAVATFAGISKLTEALMPERLKAPSKIQVRL